MKKFLKKILIYFLTVIVFFLLVNFIYYKISKNHRLVAFEVYDAIDLSGCKTEYTTLILGDSVARQIYSPDYQNESMTRCYLATNQAITVAGNVILLERFIENNPQLEEVYYISRPDSIESKTNFIYTFSYFITPLFNKQYSNYLYEDTISDLQEIYGNIWSDSEFCKWLLAKYPKMLKWYNESRQIIWEVARTIDKQKEMPDLSLIYLKRMQQICENNHIKLHFAAPPMPENYNYDDKALKMKFDSIGLSDLYEEYNKSMLRVTDNEFVDGIHLNKDYLEQNRESLLNYLLNIVYVS